MQTELTHNVSYVLIAVSTSMYFSFVSFDLSKEFL